MLAPCDAILWILDTRLVFFADASAPSLFTSTQQPLSDTKTVLQLNFLKTIVFLAPKCSNKRAISTICIASFSITLHCSLLFSLILVIPCVRTLRMCFVTRAGKGGPIRTFCICHFHFLACSCIFFLSSFSTLTGKHTNVRCLSSRPFPREGVLLSRDSKADMSQITRQIELF